MTDNVGYTPGSGATVAADDIGGVLHQRIKVVIGADGINDGDISTSNPLPIIAPSGVTISGTPNVAVTNTPSVTVSGTPNVAVTSSVVPTGAATSANQTSGNTSLASIDGKLPALSAGKLPVDTGLTQPLTDTQLRASAVPVSISGTPNVNVSNTSVPVAPVTGTIFDINAVGELIECLEAMRQYQASLTRTIGMVLPDTSGRMRVLIDAITTSLTLSTVTTVTSMTQLGTQPAAELVYGALHIGADSLRRNITVS